MSTTIIKTILLLILITILGGILRFYQLSNYPVQLGHDEVTQLYDAISIAQTGKDIYGNFLPTMFQSVNDYKSPFYTYITSLTYLVLGNKEIIIRLPGAFFGVFLIPAIFIFTLKMLRNIKIAYLAAVLTAISPFEIFYSRKSFENIPGIFFMVLGFTTFYIFLENKDKLKWLYCAVILLSFGMYTYFSHAIIIPFLCFVFFLIYHQHFLQLKRKIIFPVIFGLILIIPLLLVIYTNSGSRYRSQTVFVTKDINFGRLIDLGKSGNGQVPSYYYIKSFVDFSFNRYLNQFDPMYLFGNGLDLTNQGPLGVGLLFSFQLPFILLGISYLIKKGLIFKKENMFIVSWIILGMLPSGLTFEEHSPHRSIMVFTMLDIITAAGIYYLVKNIGSKSFNFKARFGIFTFLILAFAFQLVFFFHIYFISYPFEKSQHIHYPFKEVAKFAWSNYNNFDQIVFDPLFGQAAPIIGTGAHYYLGYYGNYPPAKMQQEYRLGGKPREVVFGKFSIRKIEWNEDVRLKNTLLILSPWSFDPKILPEINDKIIKTFYFYDHQIAFYAIKL